MSCYIIIRGPLGSGKTTLSQVLAKSLNSEHIAIDDILDEHGLTNDKEDGYVSQKSFLKANEIAIQKAAAFLESGTSVIFDGNFYWRSQIEDLVKRLDCPHTIFTLKAPLELCIERDSKRKNPHGPDAAGAVFEKVSEFTYGIEIDATRPIAVVVDEMLKTIQNK